MLEWISQPEAWIALLTLTSLEIVLGIDNIIFISILVDRLPAAQRNSARRFGLLLAMGTRLALLGSLAWIMTLKNDLFTVLGQGISGRDLILIIGGAFLLVKALLEISHSMKESTEGGETTAKKAVFWMVLLQIAMLDVIFSLDSVITAVGLVDQLSIMVIAVVLSVGIMMVAAKSIGEFITKHPSIKMLAMTFLVLVGVVLVAEGIDLHIPKGYIYFAMAFSLAVELLNIYSKKDKAVASESTPEMHAIKAAD
ncbi:MAG: TerC family protein [Hafnia sp.]